MKQHIVPFTALGVFVVTLGFWGVAQRQLTYERIRAVCEPAGYVGGYSNRWDGEGCIDRLGNMVPLYKVNR